MPRCRLSSGRYGLLIALLLVAGAVQAAPRLALVGGTIIIDVSNFGHSSDDRTGQTILIEDGQITAVGPSGEVTIPADFQIVDTSGRYLTPGLIDGFATLNNQAYANAYLALGVTSIVGVGGGRRGELILDAAPSPTICRLEDVGYETATDEELLARVQELADDGVKVLLLMYRLTPDQLRLVNRRAHELGLATVGELARSSYRDGLNCGLDAFVHTTRYSLGMASEEMRAGILREPFSDELDSPKWIYYRWLSGLSPQAPEITGYATRLARSQTFLIPTAGLLYLHQPDAINPWTWPVADLLDPADIDHPADKLTGIPAWTADQMKAYQALGAGTERIELANRAAGCRYLAGSGTDVWGTMPGISLHNELAALVRWGMTPREALAAATSNFAAAYRWAEVGAVAPGRRADILVLAADPRETVENLREIEKVLVGGIMWKPQELLAGGGDPE